VRGSVLLVERGEEDGEWRLGRENESHRWGGFFWFLFLQRGCERPSDGGGFSFVWPGWVEMNFKVRFFCVFF